MQHQNKEIEGTMQGRYLYLNIHRQGVGPGLWEIL